MKMNKATTLKKINLKLSIIPKLIIYSVNKYHNNRLNVLHHIQKNFRNKKIAIRSSHMKEDGKKVSNAGKYSSYLNINCDDLTEVKNKIDLVIKSYGRNINNNIFFVQEMVKNIKISGVVLTKDINNYSNCYVINFYEGNDSTVVTSGKNYSKTIKYFSNKKYYLKKPFSKLLKSVNEIEKKFNFPLDIEFIIDSKNKIYIVQIRKLNVPKNKIIYDAEINEDLEKLEKKITKLQKPHYDLYGDKSYFGVMPDWNPAEIIGKKPRPLALSLYQELITNHIWSENRKKYGYQDLKKFHLMTTFFGTPYIDIRIDFNSWLPENISENIKIKLINFYLNFFKNNYFLHDKIEKDLIFTSYNFSTEEKIKKKLNKILTKKEIYQLIQSLKELNKLAINENKKDLIKIKKLIEKQKAIENSKLYTIDKIYWHVEECKSLGTLPFAGLARCAFIAVDLLNSLVDKKIFSIKDKSNFMQSIDTITSKINYDYKLLSKKKFIYKYGHIRPNTYEITSLNYEEGYKKYFHKDSVIKEKKEKFSLESNQRSKIKMLIKDIKIFKSPEHLLDFIKISIENREFSKFIFTKSIDQIFRNLLMFGKKHKISIQDLSFLKIDYILDLYFNLSRGDIIKNIKNNINFNKKVYYKNLKINIPDIILSPKDIYIQKLNTTNPNYITDKKSISKIVIFSKKLNLKKLKNNIICIESADPGYDFIFSHDIKGLITKYGGYNSHMAIRCSELSIPAVIGLGEEKFSALKNKTLIEIDCKNKKINYL
jgi:phosphoenolpyruvate synthase/pyruvate phosphate dikinase